MESGKAAVDCKPFFRDCSFVSAFALALIISSFDKEAQTFPHLNKDECQEINVWVVPP